MTEWPPELSIIVLYCIVLCGQADLLKPSSRLKMIFQTLVRLFMMTVSDCCLEYQTPHQLETRVPAVIVQIQATRFMYPWLFIPFFLWGDDCEAKRFLASLFDFYAPSPVFVPGNGLITHQAHLNLFCEKSKRSGIHNYSNVVLYGTFLPHWFKEQYGYWLPCDIFIIYLLKVVRVIKFLNDIIFS